MASFFYTQQDRRLMNQQHPPWAEAGQRRCPASSSARQWSASDLGDSIWSSSLSQRRAEVQPPPCSPAPAPPGNTGSWAPGVGCGTWMKWPTRPTPCPARHGRRENEFNTAMWDLQSVRANQVRDLIVQAARCASCGTCAPMCSALWPCTAAKPRLNCAWKRWTPTSPCASRRTEDRAIRRSQPGNVYRVNASSP